MTAGAGTCAGASASRSSRASREGVSAAGTRLLARLAETEPMIAAELRPPRSDLDAAQSMDVWIDMHHTLMRLVRQETYILLTDDAVGDVEEESLTHLAANLGDTGGFEFVLPFLTCKHPLEYCRLFARRAAALGVAGLTVVGGDRGVGVPRCVPHGQDLRRILRSDQPGLVLGGWANPHRDPAEQAELISRAEFAADYVLTQVVSHHSLPSAERFQRELARRGVTLPVVYGVFLYRSANPRTLRQLGRFFPVPAAEITREFESGASPAEICARTIRALREIGAEKVYLSNLGSRDATAGLTRIRERAVARSG